MKLISISLLLICYIFTLAASQDNEQLVFVDSSNENSKELQVQSAVRAFYADSFSQNEAKHSNNWAVLVCTSRFWFNYRHIANTLSFYRTVKRLGIPDSHIILMLADDVACNARNKYPGTIYNNADRRLDLYGEDVEVDYRGYEVTVENFLRVLTGRHEQNVPKSKRLMSDDKSNVLVYMTGHGGDEFLKFQDNEEISSWDIADAFHQMNEKRRYKEILFMIDTCQANTLYFRFYSPKVMAAGSSKKKENSYSHHTSHDLGVAVIDRFTYYLLDFMESQVTSMSSKAKLNDLFSSLRPDLLYSHFGVRTDLLSRHQDQMLITDFFGYVQQFEPTHDVFTFDNAASQQEANQQFDIDQLYPISDYEKLIGALSEDDDNKELGDAKDDQDEEDTIALLYKDATTILFNLNLVVRKSLHHFVKKSQLIFEHHHQSKLYPKKQKSQHEKEQYKQVGGVCVLLGLIAVPYLTALVIDARNK
ncbi:hypothetical protein MP228_006662 [Amoeboaphelidium protococcarum]|nr:hypothetical protein MP228_006662 [Amoeboaphelidium protococcarum]